MSVLPNRLMATFKLMSSPPDSIWRLATYPNPPSSASATDAAKQRRKQAADDWIEARHTAKPQAGKQPLLEIRGGHDVGEQLGHGLLRLLKRGELAGAVGATGAVRVKARLLVAGQSAGQCRGDAIDEPLVLVHGKLPARWRVGSASLNCAAQLRRFFPMGQFGTFWDRGPRCPRFRRLNVGLTLIITTSPPIPGRAALKRVNLGRFQKF